MVKIKETISTGKTVTVDITLEADEHTVFIEAKQGNNVRTARIDFLP